MSGDGTNVVRPDDNDGFVSADTKKIDNWSLSQRSHHIRLCRSTVVR